MKTYKLLLALTAMLGAGLASFAQSTDPVTNPPPPPPRPPMMGGISDELKALIDANRETMKALMAQRQALLEQLRVATTQEEKDALIAQLRTLMQEQRQTQRELAKAIRDAIRAKRDERRKGSGG